MVYSRYDKRKHIIKRKMRSITFSLSLALLFFFTVADAQQAPSSGAKVYDFSCIQQKIQGWVDSGYYSGASIVIAAGKDSLLYRRYFGNYHPETVAYIASAGKWLAAAAIAAVVDEGRLTWDDPVQRWLPQLAGTKGKATLRQLLSHTAGYPDYQPSGNPPDHYQTLAESVAHIQPLPADTLPGTLFHYGGLAMQVAGRMAELATGKDWPTLFKEKITGPLQMLHTFFTPVDTTPGHNPMIGGGARTTLEDYRHFLSMIAQNGWFKGRRVLSPAAVEALQANQVATAIVLPGEYVENARASLRKDIYGLGEWREEVNAQGTAVLISSPGWAGAYPWIDKATGTYGFFMARVNVEKAQQNGFSSFYASPVLPLMVRDVLQSTVDTTVKTGFVQAGAARLYYEETGKGEPLILIHGHSLDHTMWDQQWHALARYYRVIRYDLRGYGRSSMPEEAHAFLHAADLYQLMQQLHIAKAHLVGLSLGGFVATDLLALHPERVLSAVLASGNLFPVPGPSHPMDSAEKQQRYKEIAALKKKGIDRMKREWFTILLRSGGSQRENMRAPLWKMIAEWDAWQPLHLEPRPLLGTDAPALLRRQQVRPPVLVLEGRSPGNTVPESPEILSLLPGAKRVFIEDAGHLCNMEQPAAFNKAVLQFLRSVND